VCGLYCAVFHAVSVCLRSVIHCCRIQVCSVSDGPSALQQLLQQQYQAAPDSPAWRTTGTAGGC
jgi:hypothetical protein